MHAWMRRYRVRLGTVAQTAEHARAELLPDLQQVPGFEAWYLIEAGTDIVATIGLFYSAESAAAGLQRQQVWFRDEWGSFQLLPPEVVEGDALIAANAATDVAVERDAPVLLPVRGRVTPASLTLSV